MSQKKAKDADSLAGQLRDTKPDAPLIYQVIPKVMGDIKAIGKTQENKAQHFNFRGIDDIYNHLKPILAKYGVFSTSEILKSESDEVVSKQGSKGLHRVIHFRYTFWATDGSSVVTETIGEAIDYGDKAANKCEAIAHKYALLQLFAIPTQEIKDPDADSPEVTQRTTKTKAELPKRVKIDGVDLLQMFEAKRGEWNSLAPAARKSAFTAWAQGYELDLPKSLPEAEKHKARKELRAVMLKKLLEADSHLDYDVNKDGEYVDPQTGEVVENQEQLAASEESTET